MIPLPITVSTPGRICLFGEHLDYLGLPVIAAAISRRIAITGNMRIDDKIVLHLPDIQSEEQFYIADKPLVYTKSRDYLRSCFNVLLKAGLTFSKGAEVSVHGNIPINSGTSSSSALIASWIYFLTQIADNPPEWNTERIAELAYHAEVSEFGEPGGMMDHYSTAVGNIIYLESQPQIFLKTLPAQLGTFVLGDSQEPKDTIGILKRVKTGMLEIVKKIQTVGHSFSLHTVNFLELNTYKDFLTKDEMLLLRGTVSNRDLLKEALFLLEKPVIDHQTLGNLLNLHQQNLRDAQQISTPKINRMLELALEAGALGGKINGSGGGGCMFAYAPETPEKVAEAIEKAGGKAYVINIDNGSRIEEKRV